MCGTFDLTVLDNLYMKAVEASGAIKNPMKPEYTFPQ
jgi:hypothetical protein